MSKFLKGNYQVNNNGSAPSAPEEKSLAEIFEAEALTQLGGSIAFVMKSNTFIWDDDENPK